MCGNISLRFLGDTKEGSTGHVGISSVSIRFGCTGNGSGAGSGMSRVETEETYL